MALWQLGEKAEARAHFERAAAVMDEDAPGAPDLPLLREESARLLGIRSPEGSMPSFKSSP